MNLKQAFKMAVKSIVSKKMRSFLTMLGIIIGVAAVVIMVSALSRGRTRRPWSTSRARAPTSWR